MVTKILKVEKVHAIIEDYCCVVSFASDLSSTPEFYFILTRQATERTGGDPIEDFEWELNIDFDDEITILNSYTYKGNQLIFVFDEGQFALKLILDENINLQPWLDFIFKN